MMKFMAIPLLAALFTSFKVDRDFFVGKIHYKYSFTDLNGKNVTDKMAPYLGREQHYYIDGKNYKAYDENNNWVQLYNSETNIYYHFKKDKTAQRISGAKRTSQKFLTTRLERTEKIAGYDCQAIQIETDNTTTIYFYTPSVKTDSKTFSKHNFGEWNKYLEATGGALSLKFIMKNYQSGYIWTSVATEVTKKDLTPKDFVFPSDIALKN